MKGLSKFYEWLNLYSSLFMIVLLAIMGYYSVGYISKFITNGNTTSYLMYVISQIVVVLTIVIQWIDGRLNSIQRSWNNLRANKHKEVKDEIPKKK